MNFVTSTPTMSVYTIAPKIKVKLKNSVNSIMVDLNENTNINIPLRNLLALIFAVAVSVTGYVNLTSRITQLEHDRNIRDVDIGNNTEFRIKWPRGELGALPEDAEQNLRLQYIEKHLEEVEKIARTLEIKANQEKCTPWDLNPKPID